jgi:RNA polymerase sigma-70 factor (ECF subfamily)
MVSSIAVLDAEISRKDIDPSATGFCDQTASTIAASSGAALAGKPAIVDLSFGKTCQFELGDPEQRSPQTLAYGNERVWLVVCNFDPRDPYARKECQRALDGCSVPQRSCPDPAPGYARCAARRRLRGLRSAICAARSVRAVEDRDPTRHRAGSPACSGGPRMTEKSFDCFCRESRDRLLRVISFYVQRREDAEEVLQDVLLEVWRRAPDYDPARSSLKGWASVIARSRALDAARAGARRLRVHATGMDDQRAEPASGPAWQPDAQLELTRARAMLQRGFANLDSHERRLMRLAYFEQMTHTEIARRLRTPLGTVKSQIAASLRKLRRALAAPELTPRACGGEGYCTRQAG